MNQGIIFRCIIRQPGSIPPRQTTIIQSEVSIDGFNAHTGVNRQILKYSENFGLRDIQMLAQKVAITDAGKIFLLCIAHDVGYLVLLHRQQAKEFSFCGIRNWHLRDRFFCCESSCRHRKIFEKRAVKGHRSVNVPFFPVEM